MPEELQKKYHEDEMARESLVTALSIMRDRHSNNKDRLAAARTILEWTKQKPATKNEHTVRRAEDFLDQLAVEERKSEPILIDGDTPGTEEAS